MTRARGTTTVRWAGLAAGLLLAGVALLSWRLPASGGELGADVRLIAMPPGELLVEPAGAFLSGRALTPGGPPADGQLTVRNVTGRRVAFRLRGLPATRDLDHLLRVELRAAGRLLAGGRLGELRSGTGSVLQLDPAESATLTARAWLPDSVGHGYEGRIVDVPVELLPGAPR